MFWYSYNSCGGSLYLTCLLREVREMTVCVVCVCVSLYPDRSVVKGVKELILGSGHLREVLEALITIATVT